MKKWGFLILIFLISSGCSLQSEKLYTISPTNAIENDEQLFHALGTQVVASVHVKHLNRINATGIDMWVDHYEYGQLKESLYQYGTVLDDQDEDDYRVIFINTPFQLDEKDYSNYRAAFISKSGSSSIESGPIENGTSASEAYAQLDENIRAKVNEPVTIAYFIKTKKSGISTNHENIFSSNNEFPQQLAEYENVYLVRMKASN